MIHLEHVRGCASSESGRGSGETFRRLLGSLERGEDFPLAELYELSYEDFEAAVGAIREWRTFRYVKDDSVPYVFPVHE